MQLKLKIDCAQRDSATNQEARMIQTATQQRAHMGPKKRRHYSYDESLDEPPGLIEKEPVDIEEAVPADENEPIEKDEENQLPDIPVFEQ
jgi:hypothetical protein